MLQYLSVHDIVWINSTVTGETLPFDYEKLEAAMAAQYNYGDSTDVRGQSANFLASFILKPPFAYGNLRTAFVAVTSFLYANGYALQVDEQGPAEAMLAAARGQATAAETIDRLAPVARPASVAPKPDLTLRVLVSYVCAANAGALKALEAEDQ